MNAANHPSHPATKPPKKGPNSGKILALAIVGAIGVGVVSQAVDPDEPKTKGEKKPTAEAVAKPDETVPAQGEPGEQPEAADTLAAVDEEQAAEASGEPSRDRQIEVIVDAASVARKPRKDVDRILGKPSSCSPFKHSDGSKKGETCYYAVPATTDENSFAIDVAFYAGRAMTMGVSDPRLAAPASALAQVGLPRTDPRVTKTGIGERWEWSGLPHVHEAFLFVSHFDEGAPAVSLRFGPADGRCCKQCPSGSSMACGDTCIAPTAKCSAEPGCACLTF